MKNIYFEKSSSHNFSECYIAKVRGGIGSFTSSEPLRRHDRQRKTLVKLREQFESVNFTGHASYLYFTFKDPADEAFFLVWSSDGIEI